MSKPPLKEALLALYLLTTFPGAAERVGSLGFSPALFAFLALYLLLAACLVAAAYVRSLAVRSLWAVLLVPPAIFLPAFARVTGQFLTYDSFITMLSSTGDTGNALAQYGSAILLSSVAAVALAAGILLKPHYRLPFRGLAAAPLAALLVLPLLFYTRGGDGGRGLPPSFTGLAYAGLAGWEAATEPRAKREPVRLTPAGAPNGDLVFVIDESVAGQYLDINHPAGVRSGLAEARPGVAVHNFGYAAAITNCSWGSNLTLRYGGTRADYRRINATMPSLFAYAKRAGYHTVYIDAQRAKPASNPLVADELAAVDETIALGQVPVAKRDMAAADLVADRLADRRADFILVNKVGAHFPVHDKYPDAYLRYRPALPRGHFVGISDTGSRAGFGGTREEWREYRNAYRNTLLWNVGAFFDRLLSRPLGQATILYTSDHGQNLHGDGSPGLNTHCSPNPAMEEGLVPLILIDGAEGGSIWSAAAADNRDRASHYQLFPTLLELMGYDRRQVTALYGPALDRPVHDEFTFNALFNARLGRRPVWRRIDITHIGAPPDDGRVAMAEQPGTGRRFPTK